MHGQALEHSVAGRQLPRVRADDPRDRSYAAAAFIDNNIHRRWSRQPRKQAQL
jgi:hypothetical protein